MNLYEQLAANRRRTWLVLAVFVGFVLLLGVGFDAASLSANGVFLPLGTVAALVGGSGTAAYGYFRGGQAVLASTKAVDLASAIAASPDRLDLRQYQNIVEEMAIAAGLPPPAAYVVADPDPNAFATGRDPGHASIAVTEGLLRLLNREQLQGVVAHEMSHIRNADIRLMTLVAALVGTVALLADWAARGWRLGMFRGSPVGSRRNGNDKGGRGAVVAALMVVWILAMILAPLIARILALFVSRTREFLADASAAELTRNPGALADALERIEAQGTPTASMKMGSAHLCIADPLGRPANEGHGVWANLMATHPPMRERVAALRGMGYEPVHGP
jgi:heat shock protein HtpX